MILILVAIVALCPAIVCPLTAQSQAQSGSCCHKPPSHRAPCPAKSVPACPYSVLEKSNATQAAAHTHLALAVVRAEPGFSLPLSSPAAHPPSRLVDANGLFLRNRVLLI
jgi:hypothetical protein